jgi:signal transduction histidine kinase
LKLLNKSTFYFLSFSGIVILLGAVIFYLSVKKDVYEQIDNSLRTEMELIRDQVEQTKSVPELGATLGHQIDVRLVNGEVKAEERISDTIITDTTGYEHPYRYLFYRGKLSADKGYVIIIFQTLREKEELLENIGLYIFFLFLSLFIISILLNYIISRKLWHPFYITVEEAEKFDIQSGSLPVLPETGITEFRRLNAVIDQMTRKMRSDYLNLKEYNENAAHEIQTPLAVMRSKLDILAQRKELRKESLNLIRSINEAVTRLFKINQGLLMISKIENSFFHDDKEVSLAVITENTLLNYREIMNLKNIKVEFVPEEKGLLWMSEMLAETLISNLISNAVRYNYDGGFIRCLIAKDHMIISNSGEPLKTDPELLFRRFHREGDNQQSVGLGLAIVKKITDRNNMRITYTCSGNVHEVRLDFRPSE